MKAKCDDYYTPNIMKDAIYVIGLFLEHHALGLAILEGGMELPDDEELYALLVAAENSKSGFLGVRVQGGIELPYAQRVVENVDDLRRKIKRTGGMERYHEVFQWLKKDDSNAYSIIKDYALYVRNKRTRSIFGDSVTRIMSRKYASHIETLRAYRRDVIYNLAREIVYPEFTLRDFRRGVNDD